MAVAADNLIWIDLEMTGLEPDTDVIIEIATIVTDAALIVARGKQHHFLTSEELVRVDPGEESAARPRAWCSGCRNG